jgi:hypothetical protein
MKFSTVSAFIELLGMYIELFLRIDRLGFKDDNVMKKMLKIFMKFSIA